jgi:hypothetical protein
VAKLGRRDARVLADRHARGASVVLRTLEHDPVLPDADDTRDHANTGTGAFKRVTLLDVRLAVANVTHWVDDHARFAEKPGGAERVRELGPIILVGGLGNFLVRQRTNA